MSLKTHPFILACLLLGTLSACSKLNSPKPGMYRAAIQLGGGEVPMQLRIDGKDSALQLWVVEGEQQAHASELKINDNELQATLPYQLGKLKARFDRNNLKGELQRPSTENALLSFPVIAKRGDNYRFNRDSLTDNADVSGTWRIKLTAASALMSLTQTRDLVDGQMQMQDAPCDVIGQVRNDDVYLAAYCKTQLWLFKGAVNKSGELDGEAWCNRDSSQHWQARHSDEMIQPLEDQSRKVTLPWAVPTR